MVLTPTAGPGTLEVIRGRVNRALNRAARPSRGWVLRRLTDIRSLVLLSCYGIALLTPALHQFEQSSTTACLADRDADHQQLSLRRVCDGTCDDPEHHHHRGPHFDDCAVCRIFGNQHIFLNLTQLAGGNGDPGIGIRPDSTLPVSLDSLTANLIRGPPVAPHL